MIVIALAIIDCGWHHFDKNPHYNQHLYRALPKVQTTCVMGLHISNFQTY